MDRTRLQQLLEAYLEQRLTDGERVELQRQLVHSREAARFFWDYVQQHALLGELLAEARGYRLARQENTRVRKYRPRRRVVLTALNVLVAAAVLVVLLVRPGGNPKTPAGPPLARLIEAQGEVLIGGDAEKTPAAAGQDLFAGQELRTGGEGSFAVLSYPDGTQLELGTDTALRLLVRGDDAGRGKKVFLVAGVLAADVAKQPEGRPMILSTPHARVKVLGTRFVSTSAPDATRIELEEGKVQVTRKSDGKTIDVQPGSFAVAARTVERFAPLPLPARVSKPFAVLPVEAGPVSAAAFSPDGATVATAGWDGTVKLWDEAAGTVRLTLDSPLVRVMALAFAPDGRTLAAAGPDRAGKFGSVVRWDPTVGRQLSAWPTFREIHALAFAPDGRTLTVGGNGGKRASDVKRFDATTGAELPAPAVHAGGVLALAFSPDGRLLALGGRDKLVRLWDVAQEQERDPLTGHADVVCAVAFSPDGQTLASSGGKDKTVRLWDPATGQVRAELKNVTGRVNALAFSPGGRVLATGAGGSATLWDLETAQEVLTFKGHKGAVLGVAFSPDGQTLATAGGDRTVRLWDVARQRKAAKLK